jgi:hypothetical protein
VERFGTRLGDSTTRPAASDARQWLVNGSRCDVRTTPFPSRACQVIALTVSEFTFELDLKSPAAFDCACRRFLDDANRALVWFIRIQALTGWCDREDTAAWLRSEPARVRHATELAASFELNEAWQFDPDRFRLAVESVGLQNRERAGMTGRSGL